MRIGAFEVGEPAPQLNNPHALAVIQPWMDASKVGSLVLSCLENYLGTAELARLARPGSFVDFTRYRPTVTRKENKSEIEIPNAIINYSKDPESHDFLFLRLLEPHMMAEVYVDSVVALLKTFGVKRYILLGSMYDMVPYTRPLLVTGSAGNLALQNALVINHIVSSNYEGPTTMLSSIGQKAEQLGIETCSMVVHLPNYLTMEEDYRGQKRLMDIISSFYNIRMPQTDIEKADEQEAEVKRLAEQFLQQQPGYKAILEQLEASYDSRMKAGTPEVPLSPEIEKFLKGLNIRFRQD